MSGLTDVSDATVVAVVIGVCSAAAFAVSNALQHCEAGALPPGGSALGLLGRLAVRPLWIAGSLIGLFAFALHAVALALGSIAAVQPLMILGVVLAVPARAALEHQRPAPGEVGAVVMCCSGVAVLVVLSTTEAGYADANGAAGILFGVGCGAAMWAASTAAGNARGGRSGPGTAAAAGIAFGLSAFLLKLAGETYHRGGWESVATSWATWLTLCTGLTGFALNQRAYQHARISQTMPVLNAVDISIAILASWIVFDAAPPLSPMHLVGYPLALVLVLIGLRRVGVSLDERHSSPNDTAAESATTA